MAVELNQNKEKLEQLEQDQHQARHQTQRDQAKQSDQLTDEAGSGVRVLPTGVPSDRLFSYTTQQLIGCGNGTTHGPDFPPLPSPPLLMFDEITKIDPTGGKAGKGLLEARMKVKPDLWFFSCHFKFDPVMPGCLGLDALWQLLGFYLGWLGAVGRGRALGAKDVRFGGQVLPDHNEVLYRVELGRVKTSPLFMGVGKGELICDGKVLYEVEGLKVGIMPTGSAN